MTMNLKFHSLAIARKLCRHCLACGIVLGSMMLLVLRNYYANQEREYL